MEHSETLEAARQDLAEQLEHSAVGKVEPLACSEWIAASALQKAVRRSDRGTADRSAATLLILDRRMLWRRLLTISVEDVGLGGPEVISLVSAAAQDHAWRREHGETRVVLKLVELLTASPKCRVADEMYSIIARGAVQADRMAELYKAPTTVLLDIVQDGSADLIVRSMAALYAAGSVRERGTRVQTRKGCDGIWTAYERLGVPASLLAACRLIFKRTYLPHAIWVPLLWLAKDTGAQITNRIDPGPHFDGIPAYAIDSHTRAGLRSLRKWRTETASLARFPAAAIFDAVAYVEGAVLEDQYRWEHSDSIHQLAVRSDLQHAGVDPTEHKVLLDEALKDLPRLHEIRRKELDAELWAEERDLFSTAAAR